MSKNSPLDNQHESGLGQDQLVLMQTMFDQAPVFMALTEGPDHRVQYINPSFRELLGNPPIPPGTPAAEVLPGLKAEDPAQVQASLQRFDHIYATGEPLIVNEFKTYFDRNRDGHLEKAYFNFVYQPLKNHSGEVYGLFLAGYEVTGHVEARQEQVHSKKRLQLALQSADVGFWEADLKHRANSFTSDQCKAHFGRSPDQEFTYEDFVQAIHPDDREYVLESMEKAIRTTRLFEAEYRVVWPDGSRHWILGRGQCLYDEEGQPYRLIGVTVDVTRHKQAQHELQEAVALRDHFLSIASHELKTPVTSLKTRAELAERRLWDEGNHTSAELVGKINRDIDRLTTLTGSLLDISQLQKEGLALEKQPFSLGDLIEEKVEMLQPVSPHTIQAEGVADYDVYGDRGRIGQVLTNLLENAIKYSPDADKIIVRCVQEEDKVVVSVIDFGIGISEEDKQSVFKRFYKGQGANRNTYPGFGIGLYISMQIIERHEGEIWIEDNPERGTVVSFSLPLVSHYSGT